MDRNVKWEEYYNKVSLEPRDAVKRAIAYYAAHDPGDKSALDLGCGNGRDTLALLRDGWKVTSVDNVPAFEEYLRKNVPEELQKDLNMVCCSFEEFEFGEYMIVNAGYSLPFCGKENYDEVLNKVTGSLKHGGIFTGNFFGVNDEWQELSLLTNKQVKDLFKGFEFIYFDEEERDGETVTGPPKHWHIFDVTAIKR